MDRIVGIETEYGCLLSKEEPHFNSELWPAKVKNYLFRKAEAGTIRTRKCVKTRRLKANEFLSIVYRLMTLSVGAKLHIKPVLNVKVI